MITDKDDNIEIINGRKYKKCKDNQIRNPITRKCINKDNKLAKKIIKIIENKKCPDDKILNIKTNRCVLKTSTTGKKLLKELDNIKYKKLTKIVKIKKNNFYKTNVNISSSKSPLVTEEIKINKLNQLQKKIKHFIYPFINRVSANIYNRKLYYFKLMKFLKHTEMNNYCIKLYSNNDKKKIFSINNTNIILHRIKNNDNPIFLGTFNDNNKELQLYKFAVKIAIFNLISSHELTIYNKITDAIINDNCPHFPIFYTSFKCNYNTKTVKINEYPNIIKYNQNEKFILFLIELANGNFNDFITDNYKNTILIKNAIAQIYISLFYFYYITKSFHKNTAWNNFLFHKIKSGGYFHYKIFDNDYYIENLGYLWVINDFSSSTIFNNSSKIIIDIDFFKFNKEFKNTNIKIDNKPLIKKLNITILDFIDKIISYHFSYFLLHTYSKTNITKLINKILKLLIQFNFIYSSINDQTKIINKNPYILSNFE